MHYFFSFSLLTCQAGALFTGAVSVGIAPTRDDSGQGDVVPRARLAAAEKGPGSAGHGLAGNPSVRGPCLCSARSRCQRVGLWCVQVSGHFPLTELFGAKRSV